MKKITDKLHSEHGAAQIVENVIVLPVVFAVIIFIIYLGQMQYQKALIDSVAERAIIWLEQAAADYQYETLAPLDLSNGASDINVGTLHTEVFDTQVEREPYRYVAGMFTENSYYDLKGLKKYIEDYIESKEIFPMGEVFVDIQEEGSLYKKVFITIEQDLIAPEILPGLDLPMMYHYAYTAQGNVMQPAEMIRNTDFVCELVEPYVGKVQDELSKVTDKIKTVMDKIGLLNSK